MFAIAENPEFTHEVAVMVPVDGGHEKQTFRARFRVVDTDAGMRFDSDDGMTEFLREVLVGGEDLVDADGRTLPWSDALRDRLLAVPYVRLALLRTYMSALTRAVEGN